MEALKRKQVEETEILLNIRKLEQVNIINYIGKRNNTIISWRIN